MKIILFKLLPALFLLVFLLTPQAVQAQGTYRCVWDTSGAIPICDGSQSSLVVNCDANHDPPPGTVSICLSENNQADCERPRLCIFSGSTGGGGGGSGGPTVTTCPSGGQGIDTALGCIPTENLTEFVKWALRWAIGIGGGIAFLLILWSGFQIMTSSGNPDKLKAGQEQLTAAISGLLFLIFSVFLLRLIGVDILQLPGFGQ